MSTKNERVSAKLWNKHWLYRTPNIYHLSMYGLAVRAPCSSPWTNMNMFVSVYVCLPSFVPEIHAWAIDSSFDADVQGGFHLLSMVHACLKHSP